MINVNGQDIKVIDFRARPPYKSFLSPNETAQLYVAYEMFHEAYGVPTTDAIRQKSMELFIQEMDDAGVDKVVVPTRFTVCKDNQEIIDLSLEYPDRIIGVVGINAFDKENSINEIKRCVIDGPCMGISMEPTLDFAGFNGPAWHLNESAVYPLYELCQKENIPLLLTYGGETFMKTSVAESLTNLALDFPELKIALCHGGWPRVNESILYTTIYPNVYLSPDCFMTGKRNAGWQDYITAANYFLQDKIFFGTAYPGMTFKATIDRFINETGILPEVLQKIMYDNAASFFNIK